MRKTHAGLLVTAAGLALAATGFMAPTARANDEKTPQKKGDNTASRESVASRSAPVRFTDFAARRNAALGAPKSPRRGVVLDEMQQLIDAGIVDPRRSLLALDEPARRGSRARAQRTLFSPRAQLAVQGSGASGGAAGVFTFGQDPPAVVDNFETYVAQDLSLGLPTSFSGGAIVGQLAPVGTVWQERSGAHHRWRRRPGRADAGLPAQPDVRD